MDKKESFYDNLICVACLCLDRKLAVISDDRAKQYYLDTLKELPLIFESVLEPKICWECDTVLLKSVSFKEQVKDCYRILQSYTNENLSENLFSDISRPPRLTICKNTPHSVEPQELLEDKKEIQIDQKDETKIETEENVQYNIESVKVEFEVSGSKNFKEESSNITHQDNKYTSDCSDDISILQNEVQQLMEKESGRAKKKKKVKNGKEKIKKTNKIVKKKQYISDISNQVKSLAKPQNIDSTSTIEVENHESHSIENGNKNDFLQANLRDSSVKLEVELASGAISSNASDNDNRYMSDCSEDLTVLENKVQLFIDIESERGRKKKVKNSKDKCKKGKKIVKKLEKEISKRKTKEVKQKIRTIELTYEDMLAERARDTCRESYVRAEFKCELCLIGFSYSKSYKEHLENKHSTSLGEYGCPICKTIMASVESFTAHYKRHMRRYECSVCGKRTMDRKVMIQHYDTTHDGTVKEYKCNLCGKLSYTIDAHRYHKNTHKKRAECKECDKTFSHRAGLMNHKLTVHKANNGFPCTVCDKVFRWKASLKKHMEKHDEKTDPELYPRCEPCGVSFSSICSYQRHMRNSLKHVTENELKYICADCNRKFANKTKLRDHIEEKHLMKTYQCNICHKPSKNRVCLDQHIRNVHKGRPKNKMCHLCGKGFPTKVQLESHIRSHTGEKPFICEYCPTTFSQQSNLYKHNRQVHMNIKSKRYPMCRKRKDKPLDILGTGTQSIYQAGTMAPIHFMHEKDYII